MLNRESVSALLLLRNAADPLRALGRSATLSDVRPIRTAAIALLVAISYYAGSQIGFLLTPAGTPIASFWPPNAILLAVLLLTSPGIWWVLLLAVLPAHLFIQLRVGIPLISSVGWFMGNIGEALLGAACIRLFKRDKPLFDSVHGVIVFLAFGVLLPTFLTSFLDAASVILTGLGQHYWMLWTTRLTSNMIADLTIVPTIVIFGANGLSWFRRVTRARYVEAAVLTLGTLIVSLLIFTSQNNADSIPAFIYAPLPLLLWAALRFGSGGLSTSMLAVALISIWNAIHSRGPLVTQSMVGAVLSVHILLIVFAIPFMLLAAILGERRRSEEILCGTRRKLIGEWERGAHRVARELHDDIVQRLTLIGLNVDQLRTQSGTSPRPSLNELYDQISGVSETTRSLSHDLYPFMLDYLGLPRALEKLCRDVGAQGGVTIKFSDHSVMLQVPSDVSRCLFRVAKEALENIAKYGHAKTAFVELKVENRLALLRIADDGPGMDSERGEAIGPTCMREQVLVLNGALEIMSEPSKGTVIEVSVPIKTSP